MHSALCFFFIYYFISLFPKTKFKTVAATTAVSTAHVSQYEYVIKGARVSETKVMIEMKTSLIKNELMKIKVLWLFGK